MLQMFGSDEEVITQIPTQIQTLSGEGSGDVLVSEYKPVPDVDYLQVCCLLALNKYGFGMILCQGSVVSRSLCTRYDLVPFFPDLLTTCIMVKRLYVMVMAPNSNAQNSKINREHKHKISLL